MCPRKRARENHRVSARYCAHKSQRDDWSTRASYGHWWSVKRLRAAQVRIDVHVEAHHAAPPCTAPLHCVGVGWRQQADANGECAKTRSARARVLCRWGDICVRAIALKRGAFLLSISLASVACTLTMNLSHPPIDCACPVWLLRRSLVGGYMATPAHKL
jgi:hypothetical protein